MPTDESTGNGTKTEVPSPIVFQCGNCRQIVADSTTWIRGTPELNTFTLQIVPSETITAAESLSTSADSFDLGSTYTQFSCSNCSQVLGMIYHTTPRHLDEIRDNYTFYTSSLKNYQIGSDASAQDPPPTDADFAILKPLPDALAQRMAIMETLIMAMHDDIERLNEEVATLRSGGSKRK
ncbi:yippee zinc-binding/DNA-binding /Mis18, centromere assembly-domain-containing protein [Lipomyces arxii]|uniref:yippee zinc-binding/DNA-binding /Mis18, centromere assembly-domain-containing protein n=1 Tax=Lipomyces arxii TaxID=56418 RepID=UPI0034CFACE1